MASSHSRPQETLFIVPSIIDRYLIREIGLTLLATLLALMAILLSHRLAGYLSKAAAGLLAKDSVLLLLLLQSIDMVIVLAPLAFLLSIMLTLGRLYRDHEMTALAAGGQGPLAVYRAIFLLATPLALLTLSAALFLLPVIMEWQFEALAKARKEAEVSMFTPGAFREIMKGQHVIYIGALDERELRNVFIQSREPDGDFSITTGARGRQDIDEQGIRHIILEQGHRYRGVPGRGDYDLLSFERATMRIDTRSSVETWRHRETLPTAQLLRSSEPMQIAELHMRLNSPLQMLLIALWAPLLARAQPREGRYGRIVAAILIYAIYFNLVGIGESWLSQGVVSSWVGLWWVHGLFLLFGLGLLLHHYAGSPGFQRLWRLVRGG
ncbi:MAG: Lipopolysaccharide export system permease protein LptF [Pseudomonadota bacterium]|nr:Lipopolysaccharide export system permease protein LptF [Pseudomonadota bacterium]